MESNSYAVDSHCHLDMLTLADDESLDDIIAQAVENRVGHILSIGVDPQKMQPIFDIVSRYQGISASCGVHPLGVKNETEIDADFLLQQASHSKVVAIGETGLDYHYHPEYAENQKAAFVTNIQVARQLNKPLIVHTREAREDTLSLLVEHKASDAGGLIHCFTEDLTWAKKVLDLGMYISFSGIVTFNNASQIREVARYVPKDRYLIETDAPYLAPKPHRGKQNLPAYVIHVAEFMAELRQVAIADILHESTHNFRRLFFKEKPLEQLKVKGR